MSKIIVGAATLALLFIGAGLVHHHYKHHRHAHHQDGFVTLKGGAKKEVAKMTKEELGSYCNDYTYDGCSYCTQQSSCGWCSNGNYGQGKCSYGGYSGPQNYYCSGNWDWGVYARCNNNQDNCNEYSSGCNSCVNAPSGTCGWCESSQTCQSGTSSGPNNGGCFNWDWTTSDCPNCAQHYSCSGCTSQGGCGWCAGGQYNGQNGMCLAGNGYGPNNGQYCPNGWTTNMGIYGNPSCSAIDCSQYTTCRGCTNAPSGTCGFCTGSKTCQAGNSNGPTQGYCNGNWEWYSSNCQNEEEAGDAKKVDVKAEIPVKKVEEKKAEVKK